MVKGVLELMARVFTVADDAFQGVRGHGRAAIDSVVYFRFIRLTHEG